MNDLLVIIGCTSPQGMMPAYLESLGKAGIDVHVESGLDVENIAAGGSLRWLVDFYRAMATRFGHYQKLVFSDGFDVVFFGTKQDVLAKIPTDCVLLAGEKNCYPNAHLRDTFPGSTPWRFVNGGLSAGTPLSYLMWCDRVLSHPAYQPMYLNQEFCNLIAHSGSAWFRIDERTELFYCLFGGYAELEFENGLPVNTLCGTRPNFAHCNGKWSPAEMFCKYERSLVK